MIPGQGTKIPTNLAVQPKKKSFTMLCGSLDGRVVWARMDTCICMPESLCCPPETMTTLLMAMAQYKIKSLIIIKIAVKRREAKGKGEKERYTHLNAEIQRITRRDKNAFLSEQCKEIE